MKYKMMRFLLIVFSISTFAQVSALAQKVDLANTSFHLLTYNVENLFDNDGIAVFSDYKKVDRDGNDLYSWKDVLTKARNTAEVIKYANNGLGPDFLVLNELESDHSDPDLSILPDIEVWKEQFAERSLAEMLEQDVHLSSIQIIWKALEEIGIEYFVASGQPPSKLEKPLSVQMNAVLSKYPFDSKKAQIHLTERARPVLETHIPIGSSTLIILANHWKSGASGADEEVIRAQNASVVRTRYDQLMQENPHSDIVITGDLNVNYDQHVNMKNKVNQVSISDILGVNGLEANDQNLYNLWHEVPVSERKSDAYRGRWGTLMHIILNKNWYDNQGLQYVDQSFGVLQIPGVNQYAHSEEPKRWSSYGNGYGYSDHFPVYFSFKMASSDFVPIKPLTSEDIRTWNKPRREWVQFSRPEELFTFNDSEPESNLLTQFYALNASNFSSDFTSYGASAIPIYYPKRNLKNKAINMHREGRLKQVIGRFDTYRGAIQFVVEDEYALIKD
jgi:hypothetical protein